MKKFLLKIILYAFLLAVVSEAVNIIYAKKINYSSGMKNIPDGIEICNFGSSHGLNDFNYENARKNYVCFNFGMGGQTLPYDYRILQNYREKISRGAVIFIPVSHFSIFGKPDTEAGDFASKNKRYYAFLSPEFIEQYDKETNFYVNYFPALAADNLISLFEVSFSKSQNISREANHNDAMPQAEKRYVNFIAKNREANGQRIYKGDAIDALYKMISLCREIGATPILITTPLLHEYVDIIKENDPKFFDDFYGLIDKVVKDTGIKYYDYSLDERYSNAYELFSDIDHMNRKGALIFTDELIKNIAEPYIMR